MREVTICEHKNGMLSGEVLDDGVYHTVSPVAWAGNGDMQEALLEALDIQLVAEQFEHEKPRIRILSDVQGDIVAVVDIDGDEYTVKTNIIGMSPCRRDETIRRMALEQAQAKANAKVDE